MENTKNNTALSKEEFLKYLQELNFEYVCLDILVPFDQQNTIKLSCELKK